MDPTICLKEILEISKELDNIIAGKVTDCSHETFRDMVGELVNNVNILHKWIAMGGFLPRQWNS